MRTASKKFTGRKGRAVFAVLAIMALVIGVVAYSASAVAAGPIIVDLTTAGASGAIGDALFVQGLPPEYASTGTGIFNPFLRVSTNDPVEQGYNTGYVFPDKPDYNQDVSWTKALPLNMVPIVNKGGTAYREFALDINQVGSGDNVLLSLEEVKLFVANQPDLHGYNGSTLGGVSPVYDMGKDNWVKMSGGLSSGSGYGDVTLYVKESVFAGATNCEYGNPKCGMYLYLWSKFGPTLPNNDGFEEWDTIGRPLLEVSKTAVTSYTQNYTWDIQKSVTPSTLNLFKGDSGETQYTVQLTKTPGTTSNYLVKGNIVIKNLTDAQKVDTIIKAPVDSLVLGGKSIPATVTCPKTFPLTMAQGETLTCTYEATVSAADAKDGTNTVTVTLNDNSASFSGSTPVTWAGATVAKNLDCVNVSDTYGGALGQFCSSQTLPTYKHSFSCLADMGAKTNTAKIVETNQTDDATVQVNCFELQTRKDAAASKTVTYNWDITKSVTPTDWKLFVGEDAKSKYTVAVNQTGTTPSAFAVAGSITIENPAPMDALLTSVTDQVSGIPGGSVVTCPSMVVPAKTGAVNGKLVCTYTKDIGNTCSAGLTNTATATAQNYNYPFGATKVASGTTAYNTAAVPIDCANASIGKEINKCVEVTDTFGGMTKVLGANVCASKTFDTYEQTFSCPDTKGGSFTNTAQITQTGQKASTTVTVACYAPTIDKTVNTGFTRKYLWDLKKTGSKTSITLPTGQTYPVNYTVDVFLQTPPYADSAWFVKGDITLTNPNPWKPMHVNTLTDMVGTTAATISGTGCSGAFDVPAGGSKTCQYSMNPAAATATNNVATATQQLYHYAWDLSATTDGTKNYAVTKPVTFGTEPTAKVDECVTVKDDKKGDLGTVCADKPPLAPQSFAYTLTIGPPLTCGDTNFKNTASIFGDDKTKALKTADWTVAVHTPCGCTYTQGFWKTHTMHGPAGPYAGFGWLQVKPNAEDSTFYLSGMSWYSLFWEPPAKGDAYIQLAHQYMAAWLNINKTIEPADQSVMPANTMAKALELLSTCNHTSNTAWKTCTVPPGNPGWHALADILGQFNEGMLGVPHCGD